MSQKANIRSPYFLKYTDINLTRVELDIHVYSGTVDTDKGTPVYQLQNDVISNQEYAIFEVSEFVSDYFTHSFAGSNYYSNTLWFTAVASLYNGGDVIRTETRHLLALDGYTTYEDGINAEGSRGALFSASTLRIPENEVVRIPVFSEDVISVTLFTPAVTGTASTSLWNTNTNEWQVDTDFWDTQASSNTNVISETATLSTGKIQYATIPSTVSRVSISTSTETKEVMVEEVCADIAGKRKVTFVNKHGAFEDLWFTGIRRDAVNVTYNEYKASDIDFGSMSYTSQSPQTNKTNIAGENLITLNSGWVHESASSSFEELLMSKNVWLTEDNVTKPVLVTQNNIEKKTNTAENIITYTITFKSAHNTNNTVI